MSAPGWAGRRGGARPAWRVLPSRGSGRGAAGSGGGQSLFRRLSSCLWNVKGRDRISKDPPFSLRHHPRSPAPQPPQPPPPSSPRSPPRRGKALPPAGKEDRGRCPFQPPARRRPEPARRLRPERKARLPGGGRGGTRSRKAAGRIGRLESPRHLNRLVAVCTIEKVADLRAGAFILN